MAEFTPTILIVDDEPEQRKLLTGFLQTRGFVTQEAASAAEALAYLRQQRPAVVLLDVRMPGQSGLEALPEIRRIDAELPVLLMTAYADLRQAVTAMKSGAVDYLSKPLDLEELETAIRDVLGLREPVTERPAHPPLPDWVVCAAPAMRQVVETVAAVAPANASVLIMGDTGVGKEVIAKLIHHWSTRAAGPLVTANCAGWSETLVESELFGHVKGAFTGANQARQGLFRAAHLGTLFLDEFGELPLAVQPKLLRAIESGEISPVGSDQVVSCDTRVIAATNRNLLDAVQTGRFREDLYYRVNVVELVVPPLTQRRDDILPLARRMTWEQTGAQVRLSPQAVQCLLTYAWPGNVRELRNAIQRACLLCRGDVILPEHLPPKVAALAVAPISEQGQLPQLERAAILAALAECNGNRTQAAKQLGLSRRALLYKLREFH